jgi:competence protein ComGC
LIEVLVVVSIIGVLAAILLPSLHRARQQAKMIKCLSNMRSLGQAAFVFSGEHDGRIQLAASEEGVEKVDRQRKKYEYVRRGELLAWPVALGVTTGLSDVDDNYKWGVRANDFNEAREREEFMSDQLEVAICPSDEVKISTPFYPRDDGLRPIPDSVEPQQPNGSSYWGYLSYGINEDVVGADDRSGPNPEAFDCWKDGNRGQMQNGAGDRLMGELTRVYDPSTCLLFVDAGPDSESEARLDPGGFANLIISAQANGPLMVDFQQRWQKRMPLKRHPKSALNVLFTDFHGQTVRPTEFYSNEVLRGIPTDYNARVRVSPYRPWE